MISKEKKVLYSLLAAILLVFGYICAFKILDRDFWWHVKAGEVMVKTHSLITVDPFAYTREGLPYLSTHEWLAQVIFYLTYHVTGTTGIILLRTFLVAGAFIAILWIDTKRLWPHMFVIFLAAYINRPSFMDRPQLFTFVFFSLFLLAASYYLRQSETASSKNLKDKFNWRRSLIIGLAVVTIFWVNTHGAAAVYGVVVIAALIAQRIFDWFSSAALVERKKANQELKYLGILLGIVVVSGFISPNTWRTFQDLVVYTNDQTLALVREWQPRGVGSYASELGPFWVIAIISLFLGTRHKIFSVALLTVTGYLSFQAYRHGFIFVLTALAVSIYQLRFSPQYIKSLSWVTERKQVVWISSLLIVLALGSYMQYHNISELQREGYKGYGAFYIAKNAYDFVEREGIKGEMFNTYAIGNYLLFRGYPNRRVYIDGRNIDYGYDFLYQTNLAGFDPKAWQQIEDKYGFSYAIIEYTIAPGAPPENGLPYVEHLAQNFVWKLVFIDDKTAVYVKDTQDNKATIQKYAFKYVTAKGLEFGQVFTSDMSAEEVVLAEEELERLAKSSPTSIKPRLLLAHHYADTGNYEKAQQFALEAQTITPFRPEVYEVLGLIAAREERWGAAAQFFEQSISLTGGTGLPINYGYLAEIFAKAGDPGKAARYQKKADSVK